MGSTLRTTIVLFIKECRNYGLADREDNNTMHHMYDFLMQDVSHIVELLNNTKTYFNDTMDNCKTSYMSVNVSHCYSIGAMAGDMTLVVTVAWKLKPLTSVPLVTKDREVATRLVVYVSFTPDPVTGIKKLDIVFEQVHDVGASEDRYISVHEVC